MGDSLTALDLGNELQVIEVACGWEHTCVLLDNHRVKCFGSSSFGQRGATPDNVMGDNLPAVDLGSAHAVVSLLGAGDVFNCVLNTVGSVKCWGWAYGGRTGRGDTTDTGLSRYHLSCNEMTNV